MENDKNKCKEEICDPCETEFKKNIQNLVDEVEGYSEKEHKEKEKEIKEALDDENNG